MRRSAKELAAVKLAAGGALDGFGCTAGEEALWLDALPTARPDSPTQLRWRIVPRFTTLELVSISQNFAGLPQILSPSCKDD